jgi:hypothetical protein
MNVPQAIERTTGEGGSSTAIRKSDYLIVAEKRSNVRGAKGVKALRRGGGNADRPEELEEKWKRNCAP